MDSNSQGPPPENHLVWAILTTVMCCMPLGIVAIIKSSKVAQLWHEGRYAEAQKAADDAKKYSIWSAIAFPIVLGLGFGIYLLILFLVVSTQGGIN